MQLELILRASKRIVFCLFVCLQFFNAQAQVPDLAWAGSVNTTRTEGRMCIDASGNLYVVGGFTGTVDFDMGSDSMKITSIGSQDIYIEKFDASGNLLWVKTIGGSGDDKGVDIACDANANIYFTGYYQATVDFDPGSGTYNLSATMSDIFICKLDSSGDFQWAKSMGGSEEDRGFGITLDNSGSVFTTGYFKGTVDFDPGSGVSNLTGLSTNSGQEIFIQKLNSSGAFQWAKRVASQKIDIGRSITSDLAGNIYVAGSYGAQADFDPGSGTFVPSFNGGEDAFVLKLTSGGNFLWARTWGGVSFEACSTIVADASGNVYTTGHYQDSVDFNTDSDTLMIQSNGNRDIFIHKLDSSGNFIWVESIGAQNYDVGTSLAVDPNGDLYTTGWFRNNPYFDPGSGSHVLSSSGGSIDVFVMKLDSSSNFLWAFSLGSSGTDQPEDIVTNGNGDTYVLGGYRGTVDFDPGSGTTNLTSIGLGDNMFILQLDECVTNYATHIRSTCSTYTWVDSITYSTNTTTPKDTLINHKGCDSIVTLNLTINPATSATFTVSACDSFTWTDGITYYANNSTATDTFVNFQGCDHVVTLNLTIRNSTSSTHTVTACDTFTWIDGITYSSSTSNTVRDTLVNAAGCDSVVTLDLQILNATAGQHTVTACDSFTWLDGITYKFSTSNAHTHTVTNAAGCDSVVTLNLTILYRNSAQHQVSSCDSFVWIDGITYTNSTNTPRQILSNASGCDSTVYLNLNIKRSTFGLDSVHACREYTWINGITYTANTTGVYHLLTNTAGCDSTVALDLSIHNIDTTTTVGGVSIQANEANAAYQWMDCRDAYKRIPGAKQQVFTPTLQGTYAVEINTGYCLDTSTCVPFSGVGLENSAFAQGIHLYPNPTQSNVTITFDESHSAVQVRVFDAAGKRVGERNFNTLLREEITLPATPGIYFVEIVSDSEKAVFLVSKY